MCLSTGSGFNCQAWAGRGAVNQYSSGEAIGHLVGDFNSDGRDDVALAGPSGSEYLCKPTGSGFVGFGANSDGQVLLNMEGNPGHSRFTDLNANGYGPLGDLVTGLIAAEGQPDKAEVCRSDGQQLMNCSLLPNVANGTLPFHIGDMDGDGRADALTLSGACQIGISAYGAGNTDARS